MTGPSGSLPMGARAVDDKPSDTLVVVPGEGFWTGSSTLPHLHHIRAAPRPRWLEEGDRTWSAGCDRDPLLAGAPILSGRPTRRSGCTTQFTWRLSRSRSAGALLQHEDRDHSARLARVRRELRVQACVLVIQPLALVARRFARDDLEAVVGDFERRLGMRDEVVIPGGVLVGAALRGGDDVLSPSRW